MQISHVANHHVTGDKSHKRDHVPEHYKGQFITTIKTSS